MERKPRVPAGSVTTKLPRPQPAPFAATSGHPARERLHAAAEQRSVFLGQQRFHIAPQCWIAVAGLREKGHQITLLDEPRFWRLVGKR